MKYHILPIALSLIFGSSGLLFGAEAAVAESTAPVRTVEDIYQGFKFRDPFMKLTGGSGGTSAVVAKKFSIEDFSIHTLDLKGILKDRSGAYAILVETASKTSLILRHGKVFDFRKNQIPGVSGRISLIQKSVTLWTPDKDVQTLRLGESEKEEEDEPEGEE